MISVILGSGELPANLASAVSSSSIFRLPLPPGSAIEKVIAREVPLADNVFVTFASVSRPPAWLKAANAKVNWVEIPEVGLRGSIGSSVHKALESIFDSISPENSAIRIIYGDTLSSLIGSNLVAVGQSSASEDWSYAPENLRTMPINSRTSENEPRIVSGLFCFEDGKLFFELLQKALGGLESSVRFEPFYRAIQDYAHVHPRSLEFIMDPDWQDLGHLSTYMTTRKLSITGRAINNFSSSESGLFITKKSTRAEKLKNEASWFREVPEELFRFLPRVILQPDADADDGDGEYRIQFIPAVTLSEKILYGENDQIDWKFVFASLDAWLDEASCFTGSSNSENHVQAEQGWFKTHFSERLSEIFSISLLDARANQEFAEKRNLIQGAVSEVSLIMDQAPLNVVHGDLILSNILISERDKIFKLIDPRGGFASKSIFGPPIYEWAKLAQSIFGRYEEILVGEYFLQDDMSQKAVHFYEDLERDSNYRTIQDWFDNNCPCSDEAKKLGGLLMISALPFHREDPNRISAMFCRGIHLIEGK